MDAYAIHYQHAGRDCVDVVCETCWSKTHVKKEYRGCKMERADFDRYSEPSDTVAWVGLGDNGDPMWERVRDLTCQLCLRILRSE